MSDTSHHPLRGYVDRTKLGVLLRGGGQEGSVFRNHLLKEKGRTKLNMFSEEWYWEKSVGWGQTN